MWLLGRVECGSGKSDNNQPNTNTVNKQGTHTELRYQIRIASKQALQASKEKQASKASKQPQNNAMHLK
jgi:hypothetical protein